MKVNYTQHLAVNTMDIEKSVRFYEDIMGFKRAASADMGDFTLVYMKVNDETSMELFDLRGVCTDGILPETQRGIRHIAFDVDSVAEWNAFLKEKGVKFIVDTVEMPQIGKRAIVVADPDGTVIELCEDM